LLSKISFYLVAYRKLFDRCCGQFFNKTGVNTHPLQVWIVYRMPLYPIEGVLTESDVYLLIHDIAVITALHTLKNGTTNEVRFTTDLPYPVKESLKKRMGLDLYGIEEIPMRWMRGDMPPQTDTHINPSRNTYIVYLTDSEGHLFVDGSALPIRKGTGVIFRQGLVHETQGTGNTPRLLLGPINDYGMDVGRHPAPLPPRPYGRVTRSPSPPKK
jgi:hypothetical protein